MHFREFLHELTLWVAPMQKFAKTSVNAKQIILPLTPSGYLFFILSSIQSLKLGSVNSEVAFLNFALHASSQLAITWSEFYIILRCQKNNPKVQEHIFNKSLTWQYVAV